MWSNLDRHIQGDMDILSESVDFWCYGVDSCLGFWCSGFGFYLVVLVFVMD